MKKAKTFNWDPDVTTIETIVEVEVPGTGGDFPYVIPTNDDDKDPVEYLSYTKYDETKDKISKVYNKGVYPDNYFVEEDRGQPMPDIYWQLQPNAFNASYGAGGMFLARIEDITSNVTSGRQNTIVEVTPVPSSFSNPQAFLSVVIAKATGTGNWGTIPEFVTAGIPPITPLTIDYESGIAGKTMVFSVTNFLSSIQQADNVHTYFLLLVGDGNAVAEVAIYSDEAITTRPGLAVSDPTFYQPFFIPA